MIKLLDILNESKQVGLLYHWTDIYHSYDIINDNFLKGYLTDTFTSQPTVSFTRNKNFLQTKSKLRNRPEICFVIDGDKLSNKYKIQPFQDPKIKKDEMEEKVLTDGIDNFSNYVIKIIIPKKRFSPGTQTYDYSPDSYDEKFKEVGGKGFFGDIKNYTNWLTDKGFKIETILKELNIQSKDPIGQGGEHIVYPSTTKPNFIVKKFTGENKYFTKDDWKKIINTAQQHPEVFAQIDKVDFDKGYFVQEKLDEKSLTKDGNELYSYLKNNNILYRNQQDKWNYSGLDIVTILYMKPDRIDMLNNTPWENTLKPKFERFFNKLNQAGYGINSNDYLGDLRLTNVGYDENGEIKILDFNFDEL